MLALIPNVPADYTLITWIERKQYMSFALFSHTHIRAILMHCISRYHILPCSMQSHTRHPHPAHPKGSLEYIESCTVSHTNHSVLRCE